MNKTGVRVRESSDSKHYTQISFSFDQSNYGIWVERENSSTDGETFPEGGIFSFLADQDDSLEIVSYIDHSSVEVFFQKGSYVVSSRVYPPEDFQAISLFSEGNDLVKLQNINVWTLKGIWD